MEGRTKTSVLNSFSSRSCHRCRQWTRVSLPPQDPCPLCQVIEPQFSIGELILSPTVCSPGGTANQRRRGSLKSHTWMGDGGSWVTPGGGVPKDPAPGPPEMSLAAVLSVARSSAFPSPFCFSHSVCGLQSKNPENTLGI